MDNEQPVAAPQPVSKQPADKKKTYSIIAVVVVVVVLLGAMKMFAGGYIGDRVAEQAIEQATGGKVNVDYNADGGTMTVKGDDGTQVQYSGGGNVTVPADWPTDVPIMDGGQLSYAVTSNPTDGKPGATVVFEIGSSVSDVAAYYTDALTANGWTIESTINTGDGTMFAATKDTRTASVYVVSSDTGTNVSVTVGS
jgi:hypothetical protein